MIITQTINIKIQNRCCIIENLNYITFLQLNINKHEINVKSINKSKI